MCLPACPFRSVSGFFQTSLIIKGYLFFRLSLSPPFPTRERKQCRASLPRKPGHMNNHAVGLIQHHFHGDLHSHADACLPGERGMTHVPSPRQGRQIYVPAHGR